MDPFDYYLWPKNSRGMIVFKSTLQALYYAANIFNHPDGLLEIQQNHRQSIADFERLRPLTEDNLQVLLDVSYQLQFYRECIEEVIRLKAVKG